MSTKTVSKCMCCGNGFTVKPATTGQFCSRSCAKVRHGHSKTGRLSPEYRSYAAMLSRCNNPNATGYSRYGGNGVVVCERWSSSFEAFLSDMGPRPRGTSIDRFPRPDRNYEPTNCRWANPSQQCRNRRRNRTVEYRGSVMTVADLAERFNVRRGLLYDRLDAGFSVAEAVETPEPAAGFGSGRYNAKLKDDDVVAIRGLSAAGETQQSIADRFHVSRELISRIVLRKTWKHLP